MEKEFDKKLIRTGEKDFYDIPPCSSQNNDLSSTCKTWPLKDVFSSCLYLGVTSFGGPIAHIGMFNKTLIEVKKIISEKEFMQLFAICNIIPGPTSSQLITAIATVKSKSLLCGVTSFLSFNLPALLVMIIIGSLTNLNHEAKSDAPNYYTNSMMIGLWQGAVALVLQAAFTLSKKVSNSESQQIIVLISFIMYFLFRKYYVMISLMALGGFYSLLKREAEFLLNKEIEKEKILKTELNKFIGIPSLITFVVCYLVLLILLIVTKGQNLTIVLMESLYRIGSSVVGGGHVVIPLMLSEFKNLITEKEIFNAFSIVSILPGPMFNIAGYLGTLINGFFAGFLCAFSIFLPGILLLFTALRFIDLIQSRPDLQFFIRGVSSATIGFIYTSCALLWYDSCVFYTSHYYIGTLNVGLAYYLIELRKVNVLIVLILNVFVSLMINLV